MLLINERPLAVEHTTINKRVCAVTGIESPVVIPFVGDPVAMMPVYTGAIVTVAPGTGEKTLSGVADA